MRPFRVFFLVFLLSSLPANCLAEVYKYVDEQGVVHFVDSKEKIPLEFRKAGATPVDLPPINREPGPRPFGSIFDSLPTFEGSIPAVRLRSAQWAAVFAACLAILGICFVTLQRSLLSRIIGCFCVVLSLLLLELLPWPF